MKSFKNKQGFSLVELLVVITIIAILSVVAFTQLGGNTVKARDSKRKQDITTIQSALELYYVEFSSYPTAPLTTGTGAGQVPRKYLSAIPTDPSTNLPYFYWVSGSEYAVGATLENDTAADTAHIVGNRETATTPATNGHFFGVATNCPVTVGLTTCLPD